MKTTRRIAKWILAITAIIILVVVLTGCEYETAVADDTDKQIAVAETLSANQATPTDIEGVCRAC